MMKGLVSGCFLAMFGWGAAMADDLSDFLPFTGGSTEGVVPMENVLSAAREQVEGTVTEIELERSKGRWVYEVEVVSANRVKTELVFDAHTGQLISRKRER